MRNFDFRRFQSQPQSATDALPLLKVSQGLPDKLHTHFHAAAALQGISRWCQQHVCHLFYHRPHVRDVLHINETACDIAAGLEKLLDSSWHSDLKGRQHVEREGVSIFHLRRSGLRPVLKMHLCPASCRLQRTPLILSWYSDYLLFQV